MTGRRLRPRAGRWLLTSLFLVLCGCGVPTQDSATALTIDNLGRPGAESVAGSDASLTTLWFVEDDRLVPVQVRMEGTTSAKLLAQLAAGPPQGSPESLRSLVGDPAHGGALVVVPADQASTEPSGEVTVAVTDSFGSLPADEQVLLLGQVVTTLGSAGATSVLVTDPGGVPLAVPLPDGRLLDRPPRPSDYAALAG